MTTVLAALDSDDCAQPVLGTAIALAVLLDAAVVALHVGENNADHSEAGERRRRRAAQDDRIPSR
jgi:nucleotide-binding universal stress UspA family protein